MLFSFFFSPPNSELSDSGETKGYYDDDNASRVSLQQSELIELVINNSIFQR